MSENDEKKVEEAKKAAERSSDFAEVYQGLGTGLRTIIRWFSTTIDKLIFTRKYAKLVSLILAVIMYLAVSYSQDNTVLSASLKSARDLSDVKVTAKYNSDTFEVSGLPSTADVTLTGDASAVTNAVSSGGTVIADLEGLTEGQHEVKLAGAGFGDNVTVKVDPATAIVTMKKKTTQQFDLSYDFINQDKMDAIYSPGTPVFEYTKVNVRASKDTLDSIAFVKALIDVSGQTADFEQDAKLIAYDSDGSPVTADIVPDTVHVSVPVVSPNKTVAIEVQVTGSVPDGKAIDSITTDQQTVTIYGPEKVLNEISSVVVTLNASTLTKNATVLRPIVLPTGVSTANISQITMNVTLGDAVTKTIDNVNINYKNNVNNYKATQPDNKTTTSVKVTGTQNNIDQITAEMIYVYVDMKDAKPGTMDFPLLVDQPENGLVKYEVTESTYRLNVLGEVNDEGEAGEVNNG